MSKTTVSRERDPNMLPSMIRTWIPLVVSYVVGWLATLGITVSDEAQLALTGAIGTIIAIAYHAVVRYAERRWPWVSILLGSRSQPVYVQTGRHSVDAVTPKGDAGSAEAS